LRFSLNYVEASPVNDLIPLDLIGSGEWAEVAEVSGEPAWVGRLAELGVRTGSRVQVLRPGRPCILRVEGCRLSVRPGRDTQILVRPVALAS
jgi:ferrous iron transport protein A